MFLYFDILILIILTITILPAIFLLRHCFRNMDSWEFWHKKTVIIFSCLLLLGALIVVYGSFVEPQIMFMRHESIDLSGINQPVKIAFIADFQVGPYKKDEYIKKVVDKILFLKPDLVFIGGDQINNAGDKMDEIKYLEPLKELAKQIPTYAVNGNHEYGISDGQSFFNDQYRLPDISNEVKEAMEKMGIKYLSNEIVVVKVNNQEFNLFGGDEYWAQKLDLSALRNRKNNFPTIALIHNPSAIFNVNGYKIDLMLSGHTHGGQIRLPFIGPIIKVSLDLPRAWHKGWVNYGDVKMFVTSGVGETGVRARLYNRPEIVLLDIK